MFSLVIGKCYVNFTEGKKSRKYMFNIKLWFSDFFVHVTRLIMFLLYCDDLELNLQYLWGMPVFSCVDTISAALHYFVQTVFPIWCHFHSAWRTSFGISCSENLLLMNSLIFCMSEKVFILPLKDIFTAHRILFDSFIPSDFNNVAPPSSHLHYSQWEICCHLYLCSCTS